MGLAALSVVRCALCVVRLAQAALRRRASRRKRASRKTQNAKPFVASVSHARLCISVAQATESRVNPYWGIFRPKDNQPAQWHDRTVLLPLCPHV
jgi:hypothetical protein